MKTRILKWLGVFLIGLTGCYDYSNFNNFAIDPFSASYVFPLINDSITLKQILEQSDSISIIQENPDHSFSILFRDSIDAGFATDQFSIPDQVFSQSLTVPTIPPIPVPAGQQLPPLSANYNEHVTTTTDAGSTVELKRIDFSSGTIQIRLVNNFHHSIVGSLTLTSLKDNQNNSLVLNFNLSTFGSVYNPPAINLVDYHFDSYNATTDVYNNFAYGVSAVITSSGAAINTGDNVSIQVSVLNPAFKRITGKINYSFDQAEQNYNIDPFQATSSVQQHLADPKLTLQIINSYGIPASVNFTKFDLVSESTFSLAHTRSDPGDMQIGIPNTITPIVDGQTNVTSTFRLNRDNSNIDDAFNIAPKSIVFGASFNLGDNSTNHNYFIDQSSTIKIKTEIEIPIYGWAEISLSDTLANLELPNIDTLGVEDGEITLSLKISNRIPFSINLQAAFIDEANEDTTKLFDNKPYEQLILSPPTVNGLSTRAAVKATDITINKAKYDKISKASKMIIYYTFALGDIDSNTDVKVRSTDNLKIQASFKISGTYKPKL